MVPLRSLLVPLFIVITLSCAFCEVLEYPTIFFKKAFKCNKGAKLSTAVAKSPITPNANWTEKVVLDATKLKLSNSTKAGCYTARIPLKVTAKVNSKMYSRSLIHVGNPTNEPLECTRTLTEKAQCKDGFGSCVYCDTCKDFHDVSNDGKALKCPLEPGTYNLVHEFCLPKSGEFLDNIPKDLQKTLELEKGASKANPYATRDYSFQLQLFETDVFLTCGQFDKPLLCPDLTPQMIGCITVVGAVKLKVIKEIDQLTAPTRGPQHITQKP